MTSCAARKAFVGAAAALLEVLSQSGCAPNAQVRTQPICAEDPPRAGSFCALIKAKDPHAFYWNYRQPRPLSHPVDK